MFKSYSNLRSNRAKFSTITIDQLFEKITTANTHVDYARAIGKKTDNANYTIVKESLIHCYYPNDFDGKSTGFIYLDIDDFSTKDEAIAYRTNLLNNEKVNKLIHACWLSLSEIGLSILIKVEGLNSYNYSHYWNSLNQLFDNRLDTCSIGYSKPNCISYDPTIFFNKESISFSLNELDNQKIRGGFSTCYTKKKEVITSTEPPSGNSLNPVYWSTQLADQEFETINTPVISVDGIQFLKIELFKYSKNKIGIGKRNKTIGAFSIQLIAMNPQATRKQLFNALLSINNKYCVEPLTKDEVIRIFNSNYSKYLTEGLEVSKYYKPKKVIWHRECQLSKSEKQSVGLKELHKAKGHGKEARQALIYEAIECLMADNKEITRKSIEELTSIKESTLKRYWKPFKEIIAEHNQSLTGTLNPVVSPVVSSTEAMRFVYSNSTADVPINQEERELVNFLKDLNVKWNKSGEVLIL